MLGRPQVVTLGSVVMLDGEDFGVVVELYASTAAPWAYSQMFRGGVRLGRVVVIVPFAGGVDSDVFAYVRAREGAPARVVGFVVQSANGRGRELVIPRRSRWSQRSAKSRKISTR